MASLGAIIGVGVGCSPNRPRRQTLRPRQPRREATPSPRKGPRPERSGGRFRPTEGA